MAINSADFIASKRQLLFFLFMLSQVSNGHDEDVFTLQYTSENFSTKIKTKNHFVMFYAPWCGHCQKLSSTWEQLAEILNKEDSNIRIAKVDCTTEVTLCSEQDVTGYPTLKFYKTGETGSIKFRGTRNLPSLTAFIDEQLGSSSMDEDVAPSPPEAVNGLLELTKNTFEKHVSSGYHFVKFYAPWCGHCQKLAPTWDKLADSLRNDDAVSISKIDCTQHRSVCGQFDIKGYPTLLWIEDGKRIDKYTGERTHEELKAYVSMMLSKSVVESNQKSENNNVPHAILSLTADSFQHGIEKGFSFVKFFAPWCGHCKRLAPTWEELDKELFTCRDVLWFLVFCGFAINYILRINLNLTIVVMVLPYPKPAAVTQCNVENSTLFWTNETSQNNNDSSSFSITRSSFENVTYEDRFAWNEYEQGLVLGAYYWLHWLTQLPGGLLARRYGTKLVFGLGNLLTALLGFFIPYVTHLYALIILRILQGLIAGVVWPSMHNMTAKWIPPNERSRFVSAYLGSSVGAAVTYPLCAAVTSFFGWGASFHVTSLLGITWYCLWQFLVYDSPQQHPRISDNEKNYIMDSISESVDEEETEIPWKSIFLSGPIWITIAAHWSSAWGFMTLMAQAPSYFNFIHGWNINTTGILAGAPHVLRMVFSYFFSIISDWLLRTKRMNLTNVRKMATFVCTGVQGIFIIALGFSGCHPLCAIIFMMTGTAVNGAISAATLTSFVDLSPNYASILLGFANIFVTWGGFISPALVGILTNNNQTMEQWRIVFLIAAANSIAGGIIYIFFGTSKEQPWNQYVKLNSNEQEMQKLDTEKKSDSDTEKTEKINCIKEK